MRRQIIYNNGLRGRELKLRWGAVRSQLDRSLTRRRHEQVKFPSNLRKFYANKFPDRKSTIRLMVKIEITLKDEQGKQLSQLESLDLQLGDRTIYEIEQAVEKFKKKILPDLSKELMIQAQNEFTKEKKTIRGSM